MAANPDRKIAIPYFILGAVLFAGLTTFCWRGAARRGFEYDEIWTLQHYAALESAAQIFEKLATPNNHPLHSLLVRWMAEGMGADELWVRLPALVSWMLLWCVIPIWACKKTNDKEVALLTLAWCGWSAPLLYYAQTSRGYEMQTLLVLLFALCLHRARRGERAETLWLAAAVACGMASVLTLPTSVLFLAPVALWHLAERYQQWRREGRAASAVRSEWKLLLAFGVLALLAAAWYWHGYEQFVKAQGYGARISSARQWLSHTWHVASSLWGVPMLLVLAAGLVLVLCQSSFGGRASRRAEHDQDGSAGASPSSTLSPKVDAALAKDRFLSVGLLMTLLAPFCLSPLTGGGPARVYLPLVPFGLLAAALGLKRLVDLLGPKLSATARLVLIVICAVLPSALLPQAWSRWAAVDWRKVVPQLQRELPADAYINYPATSGYVIGYYYWPEIGLDSDIRVPRSETCSVAQVGATDRIIGMDLRSGHTADVAVPENCVAGQKEIAGLKVALFSARNIESASPRPLRQKAIYLAAIGPGDRAEVIGQIQAMTGSDRPDKWIMLNGFLCSALRPQFSNSAQAAAVLVAENPVLTPAQMREWSAKTHQLVRFYILTERP